MSAASQWETFLRTLCVLGKLSTRSGFLGSSISGRIKIARSLGSAPPSMREMLNSERLPQTRHRSCGLSLTTSHSAHRTAFCRATAFRQRATSQGPSTYESFITEPRKTAWIYLTLIGPNCLPHHWAILTSPETAVVPKAPTFCRRPRLFIHRDCCVHKNCTFKSTALAMYRLSIRNCMTLFPFRASCAQRELVLGCCSSPRNICSSDRKSTSRNLDRPVRRTGYAPLSSVTVAS